LDVPARPIRAFRCQAVAIEHAPQVEHHRWNAPDGRDRGLAPLDGETRALLHELRWHRPPRDRRRFWVGASLALAVHLVFVGVTWREMQPRPGEPPPPRRSGDALQVRFIPRSVPRAPPPPVEAVPPAPPAPPVPPVREAPAKNAMTASLPTSPVAPVPAASTATAAPRLFDADGRALLPESRPAPASTAGYVERGVVGDARVMRHDSPVKYQATRFDEAWDKSNSLDSALKHAVDKTTVKRTITLAPGLRLHCGVAFAALSGGCGLGDPPSPPSAKDGDERLSMAPARSLAPPPDPPKPPGEDECIKIYRDGKPLPHGCPVDTPTRAVDAELRERAAKEAKQGDSGH
jgi:hypothetical protein